MRKSDDIKQSPASNQYDTQIKESKHDEIVMWLYEKSKNVEFIKSLYGMSPRNKVNIRKIERLIENPVYNQSRMLGFADLAINIEHEQPDDDNYVPKVKMYFEVKTSVNIGETIRQINYYRSSMYNSHTEHYLWFVCAPPFPSCKILDEQNIGFIEYRPVAHNL